MKDKLILSLCDYSGAWVKPYRDDDYTTVQVDPKLADGGPTIRGYGSNRYLVGMTAKEFLCSTFFDAVRQRWGVHGILAAPPCTDFAGSGARWWPAKDADGRTEASKRIIIDILDIIVKAQPKWWALENPVGRLPTLFPNELGAAKMWFHPCDHGDAYTKKTGLWGNFTTFGPSNPVEPVMYTDKNGKRGSWHWAKLGGKSARTKELRSNTPAGFAQAFKRANP